MNMRRRKRVIVQQRAWRGFDVVASRKVKLEKEVTQGLRDARSLLAIPAELARDSATHFPPDAFGKPEPW